ncbi:hypothetical protein B0H16DRAFT_1692466 [Mycena metata]|uniref:Uncharacterized protein n=1 Tax=Mycena metata TaxID=1033252 RepID=A0AAD7INQ6_9AGAR|nr:hypothetical protein B0H16DRAFT_1692466 [Mycena metata]
MDLPLVTYGITELEWPDDITYMQTSEIEPWEETTIYTHTISGKGSRNRNAKVFRRNPSIGNWIKKQGCTQDRTKQFARYSLAHQYEMPAESWGEPDVRKSGKLPALNARRGSNKFDCEKLLVVIDCQVSLLLIVRQTRRGALRACGVPLLLNGRSSLELCICRSGDRGERETGAELVLDRKEVAKLDETPGPWTSGDSGDPKEAAEFLSGSKYPKFQFGV